MIDAYINTINSKKEKENLKQEILFGQGFGIILIITAGLGYLSTNNSNIELLMKCLIALGGILLITGLVFPYILYYPSKWMKKFINKIFTIIFLCMLIIVYIFVILPISFIKQKKWSEKYGFVVWNKYTKNISWKGFEKRQDIVQKDVKSIKRSNRVKTVFEIIGYFIERKHYILLPIILILVFLGLMFFFVTSSVVTPMIYTLF